ncbi:hypothetical protein MC885_007758 [Smutsia gigantea]|nr:hypothetical protein MC885_007758 [Smutsia gigantea]
MGCRLRESQHRSSVESGALITARDGMIKTLLRLVIDSNYSPHFERFLVRLNKNGGPRNPEKIERMCALFTDLSSKDLKRDLYLVAHVIRIGTVHLTLPMTQAADLG